MLTADHLLRLVVPSSPVAWRGATYVLKRFTAKKAYANLWNLGDGEARPLTSGDHVDKLPTPAPDGSFLLFASDRSGSDQVWRIEGGDAIRLTAFPRGEIKGLAVRADGVAIVAFAAGAPETDLPLAVHLLDDPTGDSLPAWIAGFSAGVTADLPAASTPLARVYGRARNREDGSGWFGGRTHLWRLDARAGDVRRLTSGDRDFDGPAFLGDRLVALASTPGLAGDVDVTRGDIAAIDVDSGAVTAVVGPPGRPVSLSPSPDGRQLAVVATAPDDDEGAENATIHLLDPEGGLSRLDALVDRPAMDLVLDDLCAAFRPVRPLWRDGALVVGFTDRGSLRLRRVPLDGAPGQWMTDVPGVFSEPCLLPDGRIVGVWSTSSALPELAVFAPDGGVPLTRHNSEVTAEADFRRPQVVSLPNGATGWYLPARGATGPTAALLYPHGGPAVCYGERLFLEMHWWADRGYAVLWPNPRGGQGYGREFARSILRDVTPSAERGSRSRPTAHTPAWGTVDAEDLLSFADLLADRPEVDGARIAIAGGSYGGFIGLHLASTTDRFAAAIFERGLYDWSSSVGSSDFGHAQHRLFGGSWPWEEPELYLAQSPIRLVAGVKCPSLVIHSEGDLRVGPEQGLRLFAALLQQGTPTALIVFPDECHGLTRTGRLDRRIERLRQIGAFLDGVL